VDRQSAEDNERQEEEDPVAQRKKWNKIKGVFFLACTIIIWTFSALLV